MKLLTILCHGAILAVVPALAAGDQFRIATSTSSSALATAFNSPPSSQSGEGEALASNLGSEQNACGGEGRRGAARATAKARVDRLSETAVRADVSAEAYANGGHIQHCGTCQLGFCIGISGEDTEARAEASARGTVNVVFDDDARPLRYELRVTQTATGNPAGVAYHLVGLDEVIVPPGAAPVASGDPTSPIVFESRPGLAFALVVESTQVTGDRGGCCSASTSSQGTVALTISRAPIIALEQRTGTVLTPRGERRRIVGGRPSPGFPLVGALLLNGLTHCTATLVGPKTAVTAAHCLYEHPIDQMIFVRGSTINAPTSSTRVVGGDFPRGLPEGFTYDDKSLADDVGLVYLETATDKFMSLYGGMPALSTVQGAGLPLTFVGFGYELVAGELVGTGVKRQVDMPLASIDARTFLYSVPGQNTCYGDSGGPAFLSDGQQLQLAGVTSKGDVDCTSHGVDTRLDAYAAWFQGRIH